MGIGRAVTRLPRTMALPSSPSAFLSHASELHGAFQPQDLCTHSLLPGTPSPLLTFQILLSHSPEGKPLSPSALSQRSDAMPTIYVLSHSPVSWPWCSLATCALHT